MTERNHSSVGRPNEGLEYTHFGAERVQIGAKAERVGQVFRAVAPRYDMMNDLMSGGLHRLWKDALVAWLAPGLSARDYWHADLAGGTGDIAYRVQDAAGGRAQSIVIDINPAMLARGRLRPEAQRLRGQLTFVAGDAERIPLPDRSIDAVTIAFGIRNVTRIECALEEAFRVLRLGGRFLCLEFSHVSVPVLDDLYDAYSDRVIPVLGQTVAGQGDAYRYLIESIRRFPHQDEFAQMMEAGGFERVSYRDLTGGIAAMHSGWRL
ncbi:MAG: class I SAM-dependent methyltransferase [Rhizobiales bacterium]|nr:class I SAM-dependent methyltransferase [Hyphomicrobiales bacterium]